MGRLGPLNSLAFGRSPFQPPELDANGDFILGPHARDAENKDFYIQQFDDRGHPKNDSSKATVRAMQHAQNAVLETVGVVVRREEASKSAWQRQSKKRKMEDIVLENSYGIVLQKLGSLLMQSSMWCAVSLRRRMQTFRSYLGPPVLHMLRSEVRAVGLVSFFTDGLLPAISSYVLIVALERMYGRWLKIPLDMTIRGTEYSWKPFTSSTLRVGVTLIVFPVKAFGVLQSLHLIPSTFHLSPWSFVPFTRTSPIQFPALPDAWSIGSGLAFTTSICYNAFIISIISDFTKAYLHNAMYRVILLTLAPRPDRPDDLTIKAARRELTDGESVVIPGIGPENDGERLSRGRSNDFWAEIRLEMFLLIVRLKRLHIARMLNLGNEEAGSNTHHDIHTDPAYERVRARSEVLQRQAVRENLNHLRENEAERLAVQRQAHDWALAEFGISHLARSRDDSFLLQAFEIFDSDSTATPEPVDLSDEVATIGTEATTATQATTGTEDLQSSLSLFNFTAGSTYDREEREGEGRMLASLVSNDPGDAPNHQDTDTDPEQVYVPLGFLRSDSEASASLAPEDTTTDHTSETPNIPQTEASLGTNIIIPSDSPILPPEAPDSPLDRNATPPAIALNRSQSPQYPSPPSPSPASPSSSIGPLLSDTSSFSHATPNRDRRTNAVIVPSDPAQPDSRPSARPAARYSSLSSTSSDDGAAHNTFSAPRHRVTALSVFPAEMFAECLAGVLTSIVTLPLDTLYVRALVGGFLAQPASSSVGIVGLRDDVYGMGEWVGGRGGRLRYMGLMAAMFGLQGCVGGLSWMVATRMAITVGKGLGWGQL